MSSTLQEPLTLDRGMALTVAGRLNDLRHFYRRELERKDLVHAQRKELHEKVDALDLIMPAFGKGKIKRDERNMLGDPEYVILAEWDDDSLLFYEVTADELEARQNDLIGEGAVTTTYRVIAELGVPWRVAESSEGGGEEVIRERELIMAQRQAAAAEGIKNPTQRRFGNLPKFKVKET